MHVGLAAFFDQLALGGQEIFKIAQKRLGDRKLGMCVAGVYCEQKWSKPNWNFYKS